MSVFQKQQQQRGKKITISTVLGRTTLHERVRHAHSPVSEHTWRISQNDLFAMNKSWEIAFSSVKKKNRVSWFWKCVRVWSEIWCNFVSVNVDGLGWTVILLYFSNSRIEASRQQQNRITFSIWNNNMFNGRMNAFHFVQYNSLWTKCKSFHLTNYPLTIPIVACRSCFGAFPYGE